MDNGYKNNTIEQIDGIEGRITRLARPDTVCKVQKQEVRRDGRTWASLLIRERAGVVTPVY